MCPWADPEWVVHGWRVEWGNGEMVPVGGDLLRDVSQNIFIQGQLCFVIKAMDSIVFHLSLLKASFAIKGWNRNIKLNKRHTILLWGNSPYFTLLNNGSSSSSRVVTMEPYTIYLSCMYHLNHQYNHFTMATLCYWNNYPTVLSYKMSAYKTVLE